MLTLWRNKLRASDDPDRFFNAVRAVIAETGVIVGKQYTSTASTRINRICGSDRWRAAGCPRGRCCVAVMLVLDSDRNWGTILPASGMRREGKA